MNTYYEIDNNTDLEIIFPETYQDSNELSKFHEIYSNITHLIINRNIDRYIFFGLFVKLTYLKLNIGNIGQVLEYSPNLTILILKGSYYGYFDCLPDSLIFIDLIDLVGNLLEYDNLPPKLSRIYFDEYFDKNVDNLPISLTVIKFGNRFDKNICSFSCNLKEIHFGKYFNKNIDDLPYSLEIIIFSVSGLFDKSLNNLPDNIRIISLPSIYNLIINKFPKNIKKIMCIDNYKHKYNNDNELFKPYN
jgi:hypothetical protein